MMGIQGQMGQAQANRFREQGVADAQKYAGLGSGVSNIAGGYMQRQHETNLANIKKGS